MRSKREIKTCAGNSDDEGDNTNSDKADNGGIMKVTTPIAMMKVTTPIAGNVRSKRDL